jgi:lipopolysaccharide transport system permease protein
MPSDSGLELAVGPRDRAALRARSSRRFNALRYRELLRNLVLRDLRLKYRGSVFGFLWSLMNPLLMIVVYTIAFRYLLGMRSPGFVFNLMLGILAWSFFATSASMSTGSIVDSGALVKSVSFPRIILPLATVLFNLAQYLLTLLVFLPVMLYMYGVPPSAPVLLFPIFLALQLTFTIGVALILSAGTTFFRDIRHLLEVALSVLFWTTPIVYELRRIPEAFRLPILLSPMSSYITAYRDIFYYREWPGLLISSVAVAYAVLTLALGLVVFRRCESRFAEQI